MPFKQIGDVRYYIFNSFQSLSIPHAVFTRKGGFSPKPWESLNMGGTVGDDPNRVIQNKKLALNILNRNYNSVYDVWQVHSSKVIKVDKPRNPSHPYHQADAMITNNPNVTLMMRFADCVPILLFDPVKEVVGLVHAGWEGTVKKIVINALSWMGKHYGSSPGDIISGIGPSISVEKYEIKSKVERMVRNSFGNDSDNVLRRKNGLIKFDLWEANRMLLSQSGVNKIEIANICTASHLDDWYSHRGEFGRTGRFGVVIGLRK